MERSRSYDLLRIFASFLIVMLHTSAKACFARPIGTFEWDTAIAFDCITRIGVPLFVMISGAFMLDPGKDIILKDLWLKRILRLFVIFVIWSCFYGVINYRVSNLEGISDLVKSMISGSYHLWFLPMLIGLYAITPILKKWIDHAEPSEIRYLLVLFFGFSIVLGSVNALILNPETKNTIGLFYADMASSYCGYYIAGYYFKRHRPEKNVRAVLFVLLPVSPVANTAITHIYSVRRDIVDMSFADSFGLFTFVSAIAVYLLFTGLKSKKEHAAIAFLAKGTFGVYLLHVFLLEGTGLSNYIYVLHPLISIPIVSLVVFVVSLAISSLIRIIPFAGRYIC